MCCYVDSLNLHLCTSLEETELDETHKAIGLTVCGVNSTRAFVISMDIIIMKSLLMLISPIRWIVDGYIVLGTGR